MLNSQHHRVAIVALSIVDSALVFVNQDAFKSQNTIQLLDFTQNNIETINVNAFRGLEVSSVDPCIDSRLQSTLVQLTLNRNSLTSIPTRSLTYLYQLQYLYLQENRIVHIKSDTFDETQLKNLQYLYLDNNQLSHLPHRCLHRLSLQVLTLGHNRIVDIDKEAFPATLWFLDLKNNLLERIPYRALQQLSNLANLDLEGNNISAITADADTIFDGELQLLVGSNQIESIGENAFGSFRQLTLLDLSYNRISRIAPDAFTSVTQLRAIDLSYNSIVHIASSTFAHLAKSVQKIVLEENRLHAVPAAFGALRSLEHVNMNGTS